MDALIADLVAEQSQLDTLLEDFTEEDWDTPAVTCAWTLKDELLHLWVFDWAAIEMMRGTAENVLAFSDEHFGHDEVHHVTAFQHLAGAQVLQRWRTTRCRLVAAFLDVDPRARVPWAPGLPMSARSLVSARLMELWAHSVDIYDTLGLEPVVKDRIASTLFLSWQARPNAYRINGLTLPDTPVSLQVALPSGAPWAKGDPQAADVIRGTARDWALVAVRRRRWQDTDLAVVGDEARRYADVVQAFAGEAATPPTLDQLRAGRRSR